jgi:hypothetical protein
MSISEISVHEPSSRIRDMSGGWKVWFHCLLLCIISSKSEILLSIIVVILFGWAEAEIID